MKKIISLFGRFSLIALLFLLSCQKSFDSVDVSQNIESNELSVQNARLWFEQKYKNANARLNEKNPKTTHWEKAYSYQFPFGEGIVIPLSYQTNQSVSFIKNKKSSKQEPKATMALNSLNYLLIYKNGQNKFVEEVVNLIPEEDYIIQSNYRKKATPFEGFALIQGWDESFIKGYYYEGGVAKGNIVNTKNKKVLLLNCTEILYYDCPSQNVSSSGEILNYQDCHFLYSESICTVFP